MQLSTMYQTWQRALAARSEFDPWPMLSSDNFNGTQRELFLKQQQAKIDKKFLASALILSRHPGSAQALLRSTRPAPQVALHLLHLIVNTLEIWPFEEEM